MSDETADKLISMVNGSRIATEEYKNSIKKAHHTLQRNLFNQIFKEGIKGIASSDYTSRNEDEVKKAQEICDYMGWDYK